MTIERPMLPPVADQSSAIISFPKSKRPLPADRLSAMASVEKSGLKLVADHESIGEPATHEQFASMEFEPWHGKSEGTPSLTGENWMEHRISVVFAHATMFMSKRDLINLHRDVDQDHVDQLMANILETAEWLKAVAFMMEAAQMRLLASACAAVDEGVVGDGKEPPRIAEVRSTPRLWGSDMSEIIAFPGRSSKPGRTYRRHKPSERKPPERSGLNMRTAAFRNREAIVESDEADLVRDVCFDIDEAQARLARLQERLKTVRAEAEFLTAADTKLSAAIVAALLSGQR